MTTIYINMYSNNILGIFHLNSNIGNNNEQKILYNNHIFGKSHTFLLETAPI